MGAPQQQKLIEAFGERNLRIRTSLLQFVLGTFDGLGSWRDGDIDGFVTAVVPALLGAQRQVGSLADAYIAAMLSDMLGRAVRPTGIRVLTGAALRGGVDPAEVYARPIRTIWKALKAGRDFPDALAQGRNRALTLAGTDLQLAKTHAMRSLLSSNGRIVGYRRVLTGTRSCGLCVVASTQRYHKADLMPVHPSCDCNVAPIVGDHDPGQVINGGLLDDVHSRIQDRFGTASTTGRGPADYRDLLVTHEHGELGPVLARRGDAFTGPDDLA